jgi:hypothetical protein
MEDGPRETLAVPQKSGEPVLALLRVALHGDPGAMMVALHRDAGVLVADPAGLRFHHCPGRLASATSWV